MNREMETAESQTWQDWYDSQDDFGQIECDLNGVAAILILDGQNVWITTQDEWNKAMETPYNPADYEDDGDAYAALCALCTYRKDLIPFVDQSDRLYNWS